MHEDLVDFLKFIRAGLTTINLSKLHTHYIMKKEKKRIGVSFNKIQLYPFKERINTSTTK